MGVKASDIPFGGTSAADPLDITERIFRERGEGRYSLDLLPTGITFEVDRLRRDHHALHGEIAVSIANGHIPQARTIEGGYLTIGDLNLSAPRSITERANILKERSRADSIDWYGHLAEFVFKVIAAERKGKPAIILADEPEEVDQANKDTWDLEGWPVLQDLPMVLFGSGGSGKSYFAMWVAGMLAKQGLNVLYADWEFSQRDHAKRLRRLFNPMPRNLHYVRCDRPMVDEIDRLTRLIRQHGIKYIVCDSMVFALNGPADDERAGEYFRAVRQMGIGSLHIAHTTKSDDDSEKKVYGSVFFTNGARSVWFIQKANANPRGEINFGLYHRKSNIGELLKPVAYKFVFLSGATRLEKSKVEDSDELSSKLPLLERMTKLLLAGHLTQKNIAEDLDVNIASVRSVFSRNKSKFIKNGNKYGVLADGMDF